MVDVCDCHESSFFANGNPEIFIYQLQLQLKYNNA